MMIEMHGTERQKRWAATIYQYFERQFNAKLPSVRSADFWIQNRHAHTLDELYQQAKMYTHASAFTSVYPRTTIVQAQEALASLPSTLVLLDTETTGLQKKGEVCELAIVEYPSRCVLFNSLIKPHDFDVKESKKAMSKNGIAYEELVDAPTLYEQWEHIVSLLTRYYVVAFNADFDIPMIRYSASKWGIVAPHLSATCLMKIVTAYREYDYYLSLEEACSVFHVDRSMYGNTHRALADTFATCDLLAKLLQLDKETKQ